MTAASSRLLSMRRLAAMSRCLASSPQAGRQFWARRALRGGLRQWLRGPRVPWLVKAPGEPAWGLGGHPFVSPCSHAGVPAASGFLGCRDPPPSPLSSFSPSCPSLCEWTSESWCFSLCLCSGCFYAPEKPLKSCCCCAKWFSYSKKYLRRRLWGEKEDFASCPCTFSSSGIPDPVMFPVS